MSNTTNIRIYNIICCLCGLIGFFFCFVVESGDPHIPGYYLLPLSFALFHIAFQKAFKYEFGIGVLLFEAVAFFRYIIAPVITCVVHKYDGHIWSVQSTYFEAVIYMVVELFTSYCVMYFMIPYVKRKSKYEIQEFELGKFGVIKFLVVVYWLYIVIASPTMREMMFNFTLSSSDINTSYLLSDYRSTIPNEYIMFYYIGLVIVYVEGLKLIQNNRYLNRWMKIIVIALLSVLYMSCGLTDGNSVSRWGMRVAVLALVYVLLYFFPEKKKIIVTVGVIVVVVAIIVGTFFKRVSHGMDISVWESIMTYVTPSYMNEYFTGVFPVANGIDVVKTVSESRFTTFLFDTVANIPKLLSTLGITGESSATFFGTCTHHIELIIPSAAMSYFVFGEFGTWIYNAIIVYFLIVTQTRMKIAKSLYTRLLLFQIMFWCSLTMAINIQIIQANCWKYVVGIVIMCLDDKFVIRAFSNRKKRGER